jgi:hypothetical protein
METQFGLGVLYIKQIHLTDFKDWFTLLFSNESDKNKLEKHTQEKGKQRVPVVIQDKTEKHIPRKHLKVLSQEMKSQRIWRCLCGFEEDGAGGEVYC